MTGGRNFTLFLAGSSLSAIGTGAAPVALTFALFAGGSGTERVSLVMAAEALPLIGLLLLGGALADRFAPRRMMIAADLLRACTQMLLAALLAYMSVPGSGAFCAVLALVTMLGAGTALEAPGRNRFLTQIVSADGLPAANGRLMAASSASGLIGPALGGALVASAGASWAVALDGLTYLASACLLTLIRPPGDETATDAADPSLLRSLRDGWSAFIARSWVWLMVCLFGAMHLLSWAPTEVLGALLYSHQPGGALHWGALLSLMGGGAIIGAIMATRARPQRAIRAILLWLLLYPLLPIGLAAAAPYWVQGICAILGGIEMAHVNVLWESTLQRAIPPDRLSRVSAYDMLGSYCLMPLGYVLAGPLASGLGVSGALWSGAALVLFGTAFLLFRLGTDAP
ncbi:MFS transporter [Gluconacetobacter sacchari]|uniref:MFS transporter n=1 Tax=Gluconacetobacter sacchari TaxID=92759 RepID=UPI0039B36D7A